MRKVREDTRLVRMVRVFTGPALCVSCIYMYSTKIQVGTYKVLQAKRRMEMIKHSPRLGAHLSEVQRSSEKLPSTETTHADAAKLLPTERSCPGAVTHTHTHTHTASRPSTTNRPSRPSRRGRFAGWWWPPPRRRWPRG